MELDIFNNATELAKNYYKVVGVHRSNIKLINRADMKIKAFVKGYTIASKETQRIKDEFTDAIECIKTLNKIISDLENDIDEKENALNDIRVHTENIFRVTDDTFVMSYANKIMFTLDELDKIS